MELEHTLYGLAYDCPYLQRKGDCPLKEVNCLSFKEKVEWVDRLNTETKRAILVHHQVCSKNR